MFRLAHFFLMVAFPRLLKIKIQIILIKINIVRFLNSYCDFKTRTENVTVHSTNDFIKFWQLGFICFKSVKLVFKCCLRNTSSRG